MVGVAEIEVRAMRAGDPPVMAQAFTALGWTGKTIARYRQYLDEQAGGTRATLIAVVDGEFAGYLTVMWTSGYRPFAEAGVPEVVDLNVLPRLQRRGIASALMDEAEHLIATRHHTAGIGVGLFADYAPAHRMYLARGYRPDGLGIAYRGLTAVPGSSVRVDDDLALMMTRPVTPDPQRSSPEAS